MLSSTLRKEARTSFAWSRMVTWSQWKCGIPVPSFRPTNWNVSLNPFSEDVSKRMRPQDGASGSPSSNVSLSSMEGKWKPAVNRGPEPAFDYFCLRRGFNIVRQHHETY